jgi:hypothetical protein
MDLAKRKVKALPVMHHHHAIASDALTFYAIDQIGHVL